MSRRKRIVMTGLNQPYFTSKSWAICYHRQHCGSSSKKRRELLGRTTNMVCHNPLPCQTKWFLSGVGWKYNTLTLHHSHIKCRFLPSLPLPFPPYSQVDYMLFPSHPSKTTHFTFLPSLPRPFSSYVQVDYM